MTESSQQVQPTSNQLESLLRSSGVYLAKTAKLVITGEDRVRWTNGMVTNNVRDLAVNHGNESFVLNAQGRIQGTLTVYNRGEFLLVETTAHQAEKLKALFDRYIIMDDVEVTDISDKLSSVGIVGPEAASLLERCGMPAGSVARGEVKDIEWQGVGCTLVHVAEERADMYEVWIAAENASKLTEALSTCGAVQVDDDTLGQHRILRGIPRYGIDISERDLPQETAQPQVLHYSKGCYIGQEIVERIHSRGNVHRTLVGFEIEGPAPERASKVRLAEKEVGEITSASAIGTLPSRTLALGYVRREASAAGTQVTIVCADGTELKAKVEALPFAIS